MPGRTLVKEEQRCCTLHSNVHLGTDLKAWLIEVTTHSYVCWEMKIIIKNTAILKQPISSPWLYYSNPDPSS